MSLSPNRIKTDGVWASILDLARSFATLAGLAVSSDWFLPFGRGRRD